MNKLWARKDKNTQKQDGQNGPAEEIMWPRDLLVPSFKNARVATYSYESGRGVKTTLRECAEQFLNVLFQHRQKPDVSYSAIFRKNTPKSRESVGAPETAYLNWSQPRRSRHPTGLLNAILR